MSRWFRHYAGMMRDEKLVSVSVRTRQPVERVLWVWGAILESAAVVNDGGRFEFDPGEAAYFLRCDESDVAGILAGLESAGRVSHGVAVKWPDRQFDSDSSRERQRRYRERKADRDALKHGANGPDRQSDVTQTSRDGEVTPQETETDKKDSGSLRSPECAREPDDGWPMDFREQFWGRYQHKVGKHAAMKAIERVRKKREAEWSALMAGLERYIRDKPPDRAWCNPATWLNQARWLDQPAEPTRATGPPAGNGFAPRPGSREDRSERTANALRKLTDYVEAHAYDDGGCGADRAANARLLPFAEPTRSGSIHRESGDVAERLPYLGRGKGRGSG